jgi:ADP-ribosyl-[dinitrogen reductase] hydrolase
MIGAIIGDILGSSFEGNSAPFRDHPFFPEDSRFTDDTVCTIAICESTLNLSDPAASLRKWANLYPSAGYGGTFGRWMRRPRAQPYGSFANGALMRVSPAIALAESLPRAAENARKATEVTHNHEVALRAVEQYTKALWSALTGATHREVCALIEAGDYRPHAVEVRHRENRFSIRADETLEDVLSCLIPARDFGSLMRECLYHGGDTDTICAVAGPLGEALWGIPDNIRDKALGYLPMEMIRVLDKEYRRMTAINRNL